MPRYDVVVVGAGIVGLATTMRLVQQHPRLRVAVIDKEARIGAHQTSHNSGVVHRGVYYAPGSLKARLCVSGAAELTEFCDERGIPVQRCGKVIVARDEAELPALEELFKRGQANGVSGLKRIGREELAEVEPYAAGVAALHSPDTAIVDFKQVVAAYADVVQGLGADILLGHRVDDVHPRPGGLKVLTSKSELDARGLIACAGLHSDRVARLTDQTADDALRIVPFRGDYYVLRPERRSLVRGLIYPVPDPRFPFLGVHLTRRPDGEVWAGPNAVLAFAREGYRRWDLSASDLASTLSFRGFWRIAARYWQTGIEEFVRDYWKPAFVRAVQEYVPAVEAADLQPGPSGVRAQAVAADGRLVDDFVVEVSCGGRAIHVRNAPSPAATSSLSIGSMIAERAGTVFDFVRDSARH